uniref:Fibro-slime domain-containing protein n=1 Tax=uncultured bacterium Contigcl_1539 TaxID=1393650 RepID=W0FS80_9BACT|nr:fibro-slime domain-containing protein [uncultured bacterium Contigcl_1539]
MNSKRNPYRKNGRKRFLVLAVLFVIAIVLTTSYVLNKPVFALDETGGGELPGIELIEEPFENETLFGEEGLPEESGSSEPESAEAMTEATEAETTEPIEPKSEEETEELTEAEPEEETEDPTEVASGEETEERTEAETEKEPGPEEYTESVSEEETVPDDVFTEETAGDAKGRSSAKSVAIESISATADGNTYEVTVTCGQDAGIPAGARLLVVELTEEDPDYDSYLEQTAELINGDASSLSYIKLLDISIVDENGEPILPEAPVDVSIRLLDNEEVSDTTQIVHFGEETEILESSVEGDTVSFETTSFSAYAIVEGPEPSEESGWQRIMSLSELDESTEIVIGHTNGFYFTSGITRINNSRTGITKTKPAQSTPAEAAVPYHFELVNEEENQYRVYCIVDEVRKYIVQSGNSLNLTDINSASVFTIEEGDSAGIFRARGTGGYYWNMQGGNNGASFAAYNGSDGTNGAEDPNAQFYFWYHKKAENDPYGLDGATYGLMNWNGGDVGKALMGSALSGTALEAKPLTVMSTSNNQNHLFVPNESDITFWTFHYFDDDMYYLTAEVDGETLYLRIDAEGLSLISEPDEKCQIRVVPGAGIHAGQIFLQAKKQTLTFSGEVEHGFSVNGTAGKEWLNLVELSDLTSDYLMTHSARKVSVSDPSITDQSKVIVYIRYWNDADKRYDYYAISSDGSLYPVTESGDTIEWKGGQLNDLLWTFTEYYWEGTSDPNYYYELYNQFSQKYIAPQVTGNQILSPNTIGINLNGRRDGHYQTTILAWDDNNYSYVGLTVKDGRIVTCPKEEAMDFFFAEMQELNLDDNPSTVETVDHTPYGITMKIIDLSNTQNIQGQMNAFLGSKEGGVGRVLHQGLLSTNLIEDENGNWYPMTTLTERSLGELINVPGQTREVNHLFLSGTYEETGYFAYDSTQNFATLIDPETGEISDNFTVYKELGTHDDSNKPTLKHGQFFPFNELRPGEFAVVNGQNLYTFDDEEYEKLLDDSDPRKYEQMYTVDHTDRPIDYYFAVDLEASFTQTANGLDAWGHDIIFEFTGDDDFWLYVDGELVIDLGGIHSSVPGSVNFSTGDVYINGEHLYLREIFENNYRTRNADASDADVAAFLAQYFDEGETIFRDYTTHTIRIFYMERGASASNLRMRFNLAAVKQGTVALSKELDGIDDPELVMAEFAYQIWYKKGESDEEYRLTNAIPGSSTQNEDFVLYKDSVKPVDYKKTVTIGGRTYQDVFFLKPGENAEISFPEEMTSYRIVECGVNTEVYSEVKVNEEVVPKTSDEQFQDFGIAYDTTEERNDVRYVNTIDPNAVRTLSIQKELYDETGDRPIHYDEDQTEFNFRLSMAPEFETLDLTNMQPYFVKDPQGNYCKWDADSQHFVSLGKTEYSQLSPEEKTQACFHTSIYGAISKIPVDYTVEVRNVLAGTQFKVEERPGDVPDGYSFNKYIYQGEEYHDARAGVEDVVHSDPDVPDPAVVVRNLKGWGLRVNKTWADDGYMSSREAAYFAVYIHDKNDETAPLQYVDDTLRRLTFTANPQTLYWYFEHLLEGTEFDQYEIREVAITDEEYTPVIGANGYVTNDDELSFAWIDEGGEVTIDGTLIGETGSSPYTYTVHYDTGSITEDSNVRVDAVKNDREGIILKKTKWDGETTLAGAKFKLVDNEERQIGTFTSDEDGLITIAFLREDIPYTLTETSAPTGWFGLQGALTLTVNNRVITVSADSSLQPYYVVDNNAQTHQLTIKNRPYLFKAVKIDAYTDQVIPDMVFSLYHQVKVDNVIQFKPMEGYDNLITDEFGVIPQVDNTLPAGTYELHETQSLPGYQTLVVPYPQFVISETGMITLLTNRNGEVLSDPTPVEDDPDGSLSFVLTIPNQRVLTSMELKKVDGGLNPLKGSKFELKQYVTSWDDGIDYEELDLTEESEITIENLPAGWYRLTETTVPKGYVPPSAPVYFRITFDSEGIAHLTLTDEEGTDKGSTYNNASVDGSTITIINIAGAVLPHAGGSGTFLFTLGGSALILLAAMLFAIYRYKKNKAV